MADTTLPGVLLKGTAASRPAANAVAKGTIYSATDTGAITQSDGVSTWSTFATITSGLTDQGVFTYLDGTVAAAPATPATGKLRVYAKTGKVLAVKDDSGAETVFGAGGGAPSTSEYLVGAADGGLSAEKVKAALYKNYDPDEYPATFNAVSNEFDGGTGGSYSWTSAPAGSDENSTYPGFLYINDSTAHSSGGADYYYYRAAYAPGATSFSVAAKISMAAAYNANETVLCGIALLDSGDAPIWRSIIFGDGNTSTTSFHRYNDTNLGTVSLNTPFGHDFYLMIQRNASNVYIGYWSLNGRIWVKGGSSTVATTVAKVGIATLAAGSTGKFYTVDFIRVFDSAVTKIGA